MDTNTNPGSNHLPNPELDPLLITNGRVLLADGNIAETDVVIRDGIIAAFGTLRDRANPVRVVNADGGYVLPGIVDIHGDAFERQIMPRPNVHFDLGLALLDTDSQMIANGITTAFHGVTYSWEPGLRGRDNFVRLMEAMEGLSERLRCDTRIHIRFETYNTDAADEVAEWIRAGKIGLLAFNDHFPEIYEKRGDPAEMTKYSHRTGMSETEFVTYMEEVVARTDQVPGAVEKLAAAAREVGIRQLSHDDAMPETRTYYNNLGCEICEFPGTEATAEQARAYGNPIVMGAPNVVRGGSHIGAVSAADMISRGLCTILASDYYYPAQLVAAFKLHKENGLSLANAWSFISSAPAKATGLDDRGAIAEGKRADIVIVAVKEGIPPRATATIVGGQVTGLH